MTGKGEKTNRVSLKEAVTKNYSVGLHLYCSAAPSVIFHASETEIFCRPGQSLGQAVWSRVNSTSFRDFAHQKHLRRCKQADLDTHEVKALVEVLYEPPPAEFRPDFPIFKPQT